MKILMINSVCGIRSTGRICTDLADMLSARGHECKIAYGRESVPSEYEKYAVRIGSEKDVKIHGLFARIFDSSGFHSKRSTKRFVKWVEEYDPDVIHLHNIHGYYINIEILFEYLKASGKKVIWTLHDCWAFTGHCSHFDYVGCRKWLNGCENCSQKKQYPSSLLLDNSKKNYVKKKKLFSAVENLTVICPSNWLASHVKNSFLKNKEIRLIPNGIEILKFKHVDSDFRKKYNLENKVVVLGVASNWNDRKGLKDFYQLAEMLGNDYQIVLVGLTSKQIKVLPKNILPIERTNSIEELVEIYSSANILFNPTYEDTYPTVNLEAQACGLPVISYRTGGSPESIDINGVVDKGNLHSVVNLIKSKAYEDFSCSRQEFDKYENYKEYVKLYEEI